MSTYVVDISREKVGDEDAMGREFVRKAASMASSSLFAWRDRLRLNSRNGKVLLRKGGPVGMTSNCQILLIRRADAPPLTGS